MKKIILSFTLIFALLTSLFLFTPGAHANPTGPLRIKDDSHNVLGYSNDLIIAADSFNGDYLKVIADDLYLESHMIAIYENELGGFIIEDYATFEIIDGIFNTVNISTYNDATGGAGSFFGVESNNDIIRSRISVVIEAVRQFVVPDNTRPAISGQENFVTSVDDPKSVSYFQSFLTAIDETDGDVTSNIYVVNDNYTTNKSVLGTYEIVYGVKDAANNESTLKVFVTVADVTKPVITGNSSKVQISYTATWNINTFKTTLVASDNYDTLTNSMIIIESDEYTSKKTTLGTYNVVFSVTDTSGNKTTFTKQVEVIDDIAPIWSGPTTITKPSISFLTINDIKSQLNATDEKEGNVNASITVIEDNYTGNGSKVGNYTITFRAVDSKGNASTRVVTIVVQDNLPPVWYIQDGVSIKLVPPAKLTRQQIIDLLTATGQLNVTSSMQITFKEDNYSGNETVPGIYMMRLAYSDTSGNSGEHQLSITVLEDESDDPITVEPAKGFFEEVGIWIGKNILASTIIIGLLAVGILYLVLKPKKKKYRRK